MREIQVCGVISEKRVQSIVTKCKKRGGFNFNIKLYDIIYGQPQTIDGSGHCAAGWSNGCDTQTVYISPLLRNDSEQAVHIRILLSQRISGFFLMNPIIPVYKSSILKVVLVLGDLSQLEVK